MDELAPIVIPASTALAAGLAATAGTLFIGRERTTQRIERLTQSMERCNENADLRTRFERAIEKELSAYDQERYGEWRDRLVLTLAGGSVFVLGFVISAASGVPLGPWEYWGSFFLVSGFFIALSHPIGRFARVIWNRISRKPSPEIDPKDEK